MNRSFATTLCVAAVALTVFAAQAPAATVTKQVHYGPYTIPAETESGPGMIHNRLQFAVRRPCSDCFITSFRPNLVYPDGSSATMDTGPMLHHAVFTSQFRSDATCSGTWLGLAGERFFASGDERTPVVLPPGYGYRVRWYDSWNLLIDLMNHSTAAKTVYLQVTYTYRPWWESVKRVRPVWLDIDQCGDSEYFTPTGLWDEHEDWTVNVPGELVTMIGHQHGHGVAVEATNESRGGALLCRSETKTDPADPHRVLEMAPCGATLPATLHRYETVRLHSIYNSTHPAYDVMGIMLGYIRPS
jgi:hypothetical protein